MVVCARVETETDAICRRCAFQHGKPRWTACWRHPVPSHPRICICHGMSKNSGTRNHPKPSKNLSVSQIKWQVLAPNTWTNSQEPSTVRVCWTTDRAVIRHSATWRASCLSFGDLGAPGVHDLDAQKSTAWFFGTFQSSIIHQSFITHSLNVPMTWLCLSTSTMAANPCKSNIIQEILIIFSHFPIFGRFLDIWSILINYLPIFHHFSLRFGPIW